ncbi:helix-turn-helix transcriptional regulator [Pseudalkalibacillus sp. SCS-8]|uniref:helix-turn-helix transcriptional regulator n=1 Tax=Pseudalkalibacillus nanhaiensis TaxID=3115291 RepID=UPI0032DAB427
MEYINLKYIKSRRINLRITQQHMARLLGFKHASTYLKYEKGDYCFKAHHLPLIARELRCDLNQLFFGNNFAESAKTNYKHSEFCNEPLTKYVTRIYHSFFQSRHLEILPYHTQSLIKSFSFSQIS